MNYEDNWTIMDVDIENGAQGNSFVVKNKRSGLKGFLKILKDSTISERKKRFFIEIALLKMLDIDGIPKIYEDNSNLVNDKDSELYYISEYIEGLRLDKYRELKKDVVDEEKIIFLFTKLLIILKELHSNEPVKIVHRDIKPENIIITNDEKLYLVDFGIAYSSDEQTELTHTGQEIGNRFLRLPEFTAGSTNKRDHRSDLTLACGIALYMFTNERPRLLVNSVGQMPHQNLVAQKALSATEYKVLWNLIFDKAFQYKIADRWSSASEILDVLSLMKHNYVEENDYYDGILKEYSKTIDKANLETIQVNLARMQALFKECVYSILNQYHDSFKFEEMGWVYNLGDTETKDEIRVYIIGDPSKKHLPLLLTTYLLGDQLISKLSINSENYEILRRDINNKDCCFIDTSIKKVLLPKLAGLIC